VTGRPSIEAPFPARISRSLALAAGVVVAAVLLVGGASLGLATRIFLNNEAVAREYRQVLSHEEVHSVFDDLIFELQQTGSTGRLERAADTMLVQQDLARRLDALAATHRGEASTSEPEREHAALATLRELAEQAGALAQRLAATTGGLGEADIEWLNRATREVPRCVEELEESHRSRIARLLEGSQRLIHTIVALYAAFIVVGVTLVAVASVAARRGIAAPLRRLADAAQGIAEGRLETRVRVTSANEIGLLSHSFNLMADRLQEHVRELGRAQSALEEKVKETQALYRIGMEISRLQQLDRVLQSVVDRSRELLRGDAVALCLFAPGGGDIVAQATSGPPEAFRAGSAAPKGEPPQTGGPERGDARSPIIRPEYARAQLAAPLRLGDDQMGAIHVGTREEREFTADEAELLAGLATQAAIAIERARLADEVRSLAAVEERERLAREMHDDLAQALGLLYMKLQGALARPADAPAVAADLREMLDITEGAYEGVRQSIFGLRTFVSRGLGLVPTLTEYLHEFSAHNGIAVELEAAGTPLGPIPPASEVQAVRIIQEALTNVRKHAATDRARVRLQRDGAWLRVTIEDDGVGWDRLASRDRLHFGLQTMRERAEGVGGRLEVEAAPGRGTRVVATLPGGGA
jgi:nitrate/nitrite-specific signal transduction histidine kinase